MLARLSASGHHNSPARGHHSALMGRVVACHGMGREASERCFPHPSIKSCLNSGRMLVFSPPPHQDVLHMAVADSDDLEELLTRLEHTTQLPRGLLGRLVADVLDHFSETTEAVVRRRHHELQADGLTNPAIWDQLARELPQRRVSAPRLSARQLRRIVYG